MSLEGIDQIMERFAIGIVKAHQYFVFFEHFDFHNLFRLVLRRQICQAVRARQGRFNDIENLIETHRLQQPRDVFVSGHHWR